MSKIQENPKEPTKMSSEESLQDGPADEMKQSQTSKQPRDLDPMGVISKVDQKKVNETQKFTLSQTSSVSIPPISRKNDKKKEEEILRRNSQNNSISNT